MKPNFLVIGAPKAATTSICTNLGKHPDVFMCRPKEPFFFAYEHVYSRGWEWYECLFADAAGATAIGEGSTVYSQLETFPNTLARIVRHLPDARIIYAVRHPLERIQSHWIEMTSQGLTMSPFNIAIREDPQYIDASSYYRQLRSYREYFSDDRILIIFYEEYCADPNAILGKCFRFLGLDDSFELHDADEIVYPSEGKRVDKPLTNLLRRFVPRFSAMRDSAPKPIRELVKRYLKTEIKGKPEWDEDTLAFAVRSLTDDTRAFLRHCGKPEDYWVLEH